MDLVLGFDGGEDSEGVLHHHHQQYMELNSSPLWVHGEFLQFYPPDDIKQYSISSKNVLSSSRPPLHPGAPALRQECVSSHVVMENSFYIDRLLYSRHLRTQNTGSDETSRLRRR